MAETGYRVGDDLVVWFELEPTGEGFAPAGAREVAGLLEPALEPLIEGAKVVIAKARELAPAKVEVTFGIKATGTANFVVAKAASEANFSITMTWEQERKPE